jgi:ABC-type amino acid transport system permease subunit
LPVAYRIIVRPLTSEFLTIFKNSSVALTIGVVETTAQARQIEEYTFQGIDAFTAAILRRQSNRPAVRRFGSGAEVTIFLDGR